MGVTIGVDIPCEVKATLLRDPDDKAIKKVQVRSQITDAHNLVSTSSYYALRELGVRLGKHETLQIEIESEIPIAVGLKSSSAISTAVVGAILNLFSNYGSAKSSEKILKTSCNASKDSGASITGAYDDAAASLLGGLVVSDNSKMKLLKHSRVPPSLGTIVKILVPKQKKMFTSSVDRSVYSKYNSMCLEAFRYACESEIAQAMLMNSVVQCAALGYSIMPVISALSEGACCSGVSGKGPAVSAICRNSKEGRRVERVWTEQNSLSSVITTRVLQPQ
jgi:shikimate kinase